MNTLLKTRAAAGLVALLTSAVLVGCGTDSDPASPTPGAATADPDVSDLRDVQLESGVPEDCLDVFPTAVSAADLADVTMLPADWPEAPAGAVLCQTSATMDGGVEIADYATDQPASDVLDSYEAALSSYDVERGDQGIGDQLTGTAGDVAFEITTREGAYSIQLAAAQ